MPSPMRGRAPLRRGRALTAFGLWLGVAAIYVLSSPGRIDSVDGQIRFEVANNILTIGEPVLRDPAIRHWGTPAEEKVYAKYGAGASIAALPMVWLGGLAEDPFGERRRFFFSLTTPLIAALIAPLMFLFLLALEVDAGRAVVWTLVGCLASLLWPAATTVLDQAQHATLLFAALFFAFLGGRRDSMPLAALGGLCAGLLVNYLESYALLFPAIAVATLSGTGSRNRKAALFFAFLAATAVGLLLWGYYNWLCFGDPLIPSKLRSGFFSHPSSERTPVGALAGLLLSPGKGVLLYSPTVVLGIMGFRRLWRRQEALAAAVALATVLHLCFMMGIRFWHGDWCWGPRYLVILLPLWALAFPFAAPDRPRRALAAVLVAASLGVQLLGLAVVHERFFHERGLPTFFWARDPGFYWRNSALFARPREILDPEGPRLIAEAEHFAPGPYARLVTYFISNLPGPKETPRRMRDYQVFYLPRPWPLWMRRIDRDRYLLPIAPQRWTVLLAGGVLMGVGLVSAGCRRYRAG